MKCLTTEVAGCILSRDCELIKEKKCQDEGVAQCDGHGEDDAECVDAE